MASDWRLSTWGEEISLEYGKALREHDTPTGRYRVYGSNGPIGWTNEPLAPGPGVILGRKGAYRGVEYSPEPFFVIDTAYFVVPKTELDMRWLYYAIKHHKLGEIDDGSPIPSTTRAAVYIQEFEVPPTPEQRAIALVLGTLDDKIELNRKMNETLEGIAGAIFKSWFVDFDPVRAKAASREPGLPRQIADLFPAVLRNSEIGQLPAEWSTRPVFECARFINGLAFRDVHFSNDRTGVPIVKIAELKNGITSQTRYTRDEMDPRYKLRPGDIVFSWSGSPDTSIDTFIWTLGDAWLNQHVFRVAVTRPDDRAFIYFLLKHLRPVFIEIARNKQTTGLGHVTAQDLRRLRVAIPPDDILGVFNAIASPLFESMYQRLVESHYLAECRDTLLPKLLSGELRIPQTQRLLRRAT